VKTKMEEREKSYEFIVIGGGMAGIAAAVEAARRGIRTALIQDRPVLGGNASKEIRVWLHGADGGENNGYFRETGLMEELKLANLYWNPKGNAESWHLILHNAVMAEPNLDVFLNTVVTEVEMDGDRIKSVKAFTLASEIWTVFHGQYFADTTGDGTIGYLAGVPYRRGQESREEFGERLARDTYEPYTMGGTIMFLAKDTGHPVDYQRPPWAHAFEEKDLAHRHHSHKDNGIYFWWMEWGGTQDSIHDNEDVKYELWRIVYGMWDHLKNAPEHREATRNLDLEWVGTLPGKRESRRLMGAYLLTEQDILNQTDFPDTVAYGGWNLDHHPPKGFWDQEHTPSFHYHIPGLYGIPLRSLYADTCSNLFFAGRSISTTHVAMCSTRVMLTGALMGAGVGAAVQECIRSGRAPSELDGEALQRIRQSLLKNDYYLPGVRNEDPLDLALSARVSASSVHSLEVMERADTHRLPLSGKGCMVMFPMTGGSLEEVGLLLEGSGSLQVKLWKGDAKHNYIPSVELNRAEIEVRAWEARSWVRIPVPAGELSSGWHFLELSGEGLFLHTSRDVLTGVRLMRPVYTGRDMVNDFSRWARMNGAGSPCLKVFPEQQVFLPSETTNGYGRPYGLPNLWISDETGFQNPEWIKLEWDSPRGIGEIRIAFDTNLDLDLRNMWVDYEFRVLPNCVRHYKLEAFTAGEWIVLAEVKDNIHRHRTHRFDRVSADRVRVTLYSTWGAPYASVYEIRAY
jgi:hypothetical protein